MKKVLTIIVLALISCLAIAQTGVTFVVDENLAPIEESNKYLFDGERLVNSILYDENIPKEAYHIVATSFADAQCMKSMGKDAFYQCIVHAYANHKSITLSPDMIWLLISQGFARYVNAHSEELRPLLVSHTGKINLAIETQKDLFSGDADWPKLIDDFASQIGRYTKDDIAKTITADFSTTGQVERVASQITLMESVKSYFEYIVYYVACGIPSITLEGTPSDWQLVLEKTRRLEAYGLGQWTKSLEPILKEFVRAAEGNPKQSFWQSMVKKHKVNKLKYGGCSSEKPTKLDGWLLKFFPDENGRTLDRVPTTKDMPSERVRVGFKYRILDPEQGTVMSETPMELWAGFIGAEEDTITNTLTPKIGWLVRQTESDDEVLNDMKKKNDGWGIELRVNEVPEVLSRLEHIKRLNLVFTDDVVLPDWFYNLQIDNLRIEGKLTDEQEAAIRGHFPNAIVRGIGSLEDQLVSSKVSKPQKAKNAKTVKSGDKISGTVSDEAGPLMGATVCEIDSNGRIVNLAVTDMNGDFSMKVKNPQDRLRLSYVGMKTVIVPIDKAKKCKIKMESAITIRDPRVFLRTEGKSNLPIPKKEINESILTIDMSEFEAIGIENDGEGVPNENNPSDYIHLTDEEQALVTPVNDLGFNMLRKVGSKKSILLSPLGMTYALGLISNGAAGQTRKQINKVLGCDDSQAANINTFCHKVLTEAPTLDKLTTMEISNDFFSDKSYTPMPAFVKVAKDYYDTELSSLDFGSDKSVDEINQKISQRSNGMLPQVQEKAKIGPSMGYALVNTIYFKSIWREKFRKAATNDEVFKDEDGKETLVPMMNQRHKFFYTEDDLCQTLCLPYSNGSYQMIILLPNKGKTVSEVAQSLTADSWQKSYNQLKSILVNVKLPRFESSSDVELTDVMKTLGMPNAFSMTKADFSRLFDLKSCIGMIEQVGRIKVDETGTEASVATLLQGRIAGLDLTPPETVNFYATHPFLYIIREVSTGTIFFIGQYMGT